MDDMPDNPDVRMVREHVTQLADRIRREVLTIKPHG